MEKTTRYAEIPQLNGAAFSDPSYDGSVWCQYRNDFHPSSGWVMRMESVRDKEGVAEFYLFLGRKTTMSALQVIENDQGGLSTRHYVHHELAEPKEIGIDTARVFVGSYKNFQEWAEEGSIYTAADGLFGDLTVITSKGEDEPCGFFLQGGIDTDITSEGDMFRTVTAAFGGHEITQERFEQITNPNNHQLRMELAKEMRRANAMEKTDGQPPKPNKNQPER